MKKSLLVVICVLVLIASAFAGVLIFNRNQEKKALQSEIRPYIKDYPTDILVIGEKLWFPEGLFVRYVETITNETLQKKEGCTEQFIILSNRSGNLQIGQDELKLISNKLDAMECDFFCIGNALDNELVKAGIFDSPQPENHSTGYVYHAYGQKMHGNGFSDSDFYYDDSPQGIYDHLEDMWHFIFSDRYR